MPVMKGAFIMAAVNPYDPHFAVHNTELATDGLNRIKMNLKSDYALVAESPNEVILSNKTTTIDQEEIITLRHKVIPKVNTNAVITYPAPVKTGVMYTVGIDEVLRLHNESMDTNTDRPISAYLQIRHERSGDITDSVICEVLTRLVSIFWQDDGTFRVPDFVRSALQPTED
jgi:hypothetical protein